MSQITLSKNEFKVLSSDTRVNILKLLKERNHTLSELAQKLSMASPSIKQHLDLLVTSQLIEQLDEGRKWKYYRLSRKGKELVVEEHQPALVMLALGASSIVLIGLLVIAFLSITALQSMGSTSSNLLNAPASEAVIADSAEKSFGQATPPLPEIATGSGSEEEGNATQAGAGDAATEASRATAQAGEQGIIPYMLLFFSTIAALAVGFFAAKAAKGRRQN
ncbi:MAG: winged helix-turn-helix domain-containing protein [Candidatus Diapherotrites archaeon]